jgi:hypothetical protein
LDASGPGSTLRPLGVGEVLDRAVNLCVKHFIPLTLIFLVYAIPYAVVQYFATKDTTSLVQALVSSIQSGKNGDPAELSRALSAGSAPNAWIGVLLVLTFFVYPVPAAALIVAAASFYLGRPASFQDAYRAALPRWGHLLGLNIMYGFAVGFLYLALGFATLVLVFGIAFLYSLSHVAGIVIGIITGTIAALFIFALLLVLVLSWQVSYYGCVLEKQNLAVAFVQGMKRVFLGIGLQRALLVGLAYVAIALGISFVSVVGETVLVGILRSGIAGTIYTTIVRIATAAFTTAFIAIFYFDLRVREEGLDLQMAALAAKSES